MCEWSLRVSDLALDHVTVLEHKLVPKDSVVNLGQKNLESSFFDFQTRGLKSTTLSPDGSPYPYHFLTSALFRHSAKLQEEILATGGSGSLSRWGSRWLMLCRGDEENNVHAAWCSVGVRGHPVVCHDYRKGGWERIEHHIVSFLVSSPFVSWARMIVDVSTSDGNC